MQTGREDVSEVELEEHLAPSAFGRWRLQSRTGWHVTPLTPTPLNPPDYDYGSEGWGFDSLRARLPPSVVSAHARFRRPTPRGRAAPPCPSAGWRLASTR